MSQPNAPTLEVHLTPEAMATQMAHDVRDGLTAEQKSVPPTWFYDDLGCDLFDQITRLPEYYPTRTERGILAEASGDIVRSVGATTVVELGSGTSEKTAILLHAARDADLLRRFVPFDVSRSVIVDAMDRLQEEYPAVSFHGVVGDFRHHLGGFLDSTRTDDPRLVVFLGGTIGNFDEPGRLDFHREVAAGLGDDDRILLGTDLVKEPERLERAYDDAAGVTAEFNKNVLTVMNRELDGDFDIGAFDHVARWNDEDRRIEMRLRSHRHQSVRLDALELEVEFAEGEELLTEISCKFTPDSLAEELADGGLRVTDQFSDDARDFLVTIAGPA